ncbi:hypothetical protein CHUAL_001748 [Chamberlinius hualienensis]
MISAMPAVAIRRERSKSTDKTPHPPMTRRRRFVEYYHKKIQRMANMRPTDRNYSTATTPENELPPELLVEVDPYSGKRCSTLQRYLGYMPIFHAGCVLIAAGLVILFLSVGTIKADITTLRAFGSFFVILGAMLCFLRTVFFKRQTTPRHRHVLRLRSSDSFATKLYNSNGNGEQETGMSPGITMEMISELASSPGTGKRDKNDLFLQQTQPQPQQLPQTNPSNNNILTSTLPPTPPKPTSNSQPVDGLVKSSSMHLFPKQDPTAGSERRSPSPLLLRPNNSTERMLQSSEAEEERSL